MGTNYYHHEAPPCSECGRPHEAKHIGKSSAGWCFSLRVYPNEGIASLDDWKLRFSKGEIRDEYGSIVTPEEMIERITVRGIPRKDRIHVRWHPGSYAEPGPDGLARHRIDGRHCIGHGPGPWDHIAGEFS